MVRDENEEQEDEGGGIGPVEGMADLIVDDAGQMQHIIDPAAAQLEDVRRAIGRWKDGAKTFLSASASPIDIPCCKGGSGTPG